MEMGGTAYYLYCILPQGHPFHLTESGIDGRTVFTRAVRNLVAVVSEVPVADFCGAAAEAHLMDLAWIGPRACRHEAVIEETMRQSPVMPARFATLFRTIVSLEQFLSVHNDQIASFFHWLGDRQEWAVKGFVDRALARTALSAEGQAKIPDALPGMTYFQRKRNETSSVKELNQRLKTICREAALELQQAANGFHERRVVDSADGQSPFEVISTWAFVFSPVAETSFRERVERLNRLHTSTGLAFRLSGPWPPYSFTPLLASEEQA
jgi:Gas vesicle synthesis protein GvpL/GvpF